MEKDKRSAETVNVAFEEPSFRRPSLPHQTRGTDANGNKSLTCLSEFAFAVLSSSCALCSRASDMDTKRCGADSAVMAAAERTKPG